MAINFNRPFGSNTNNGGNVAGAAGTTPAAKPKAMLWLNAGYTTTVVVDGVQEERFVNLPMGMPVDTMELLPTNSRNAEFAQFRMAQNDLLKQIMELGKSLAPGEAKTINLELQLRRVNEDAAPVPNGENPFARIGGLNLLG